MPPSLDPQRPAPLVVNLHGLRSNAIEQAFYSGLPQVGSAHGYVVVTPESASGRKGWKLPGMPGGTEDIKYIGALLDHLEQTLCVDRRRQFAVGMSNGGGLAAALVCGLPGRLAGVASIAGITLARPCATPRPTTIIAFHGTGDRVIPYQGGLPYGGDQGSIPSWMRPANGNITLPSVTSVINQWVRAFGCGIRVGTGVTTDGIRVFHRGGCRNDTDVMLFTVVGGGHTWPGAFPIGIGKTTDKLDATAGILREFDQTPPATR